MQPIRITLAMALGSLLVGLPASGPVVAQEHETGRGPEKLEALNASYRRQLRRESNGGAWVAADLAGVAERSSGLEAGRAATGRCSTWRSRRNLCPEAQAARPGTAWRRPPRAAADVPRLGRAGPGSGAGPTTERARPGARRLRRRCSAGLVPRRCRLVTADGCRDGGTGVERSLPPAR